MCTWGSVHRRCASIASAPTSCTPSLLLLLSQRPRPSTSRYDVTPQGSPDPPTSVHVPACPLVQPRPRAQLRLCWPKDGQDGQDGHGGRLGPLIRASPRSQRVRLHFP